MARNGTGPAPDAAGTLQRLEKATEAAREATLETREATRAAHEALSDVTRVRRELGDAMAAHRVQLTTFSDEFAEETVKLLHARDKALEAYVNSRMHEVIRAFNQLLDTAEETTKLMVRDTMAAMMNLASVMVLHDIGDPTVAARVANKAMPSDHTIEQTMHMVNQAMPSQGPRLSCNCGVNHEEG